MITLDLMQNGGMSQKAGGAHEGPSEPLEPGAMSPNAFQRGPLTEGHAALSPGHKPPAEHVTVPEPGTMRHGQAAMPGTVPHVDMSGSRAVIRPVHPGTGAAVGGGSR